MAQNDYYYNFLNCIHVYTQEAGGHLVVVANNDESLEPIGVSLQLHGKLFIPAVLLTHEAGQMLASAVSSRNG